MISNFPLKITTTTGGIVLLSLFLYLTEITSCYNSKILKLCLAVFGLLIVMLTIVLMNPQEQTNDQLKENIKIFAKYGMRVAAPWLIGFLFCCIDELPTIGHLSWRHEICTGIVVGIAIIVTFNIVYSAFK